MSRPFARIVGIAAMLPRRDTVEPEAPRRSGHLHGEVEGIDGYRALNVLRVDMALTDGERAGGLLGRGDDPGRLRGPQGLPASRTLDQIRRRDIVGAGPARGAAPTRDHVDRRTETGGPDRRGRRGRIREPGAPQPASLDR